MYKIDDEYEFLTKDLLKKEYIVNGLSDKKIAEKYNIGSKATVWRRRKHHGIDNKSPNKSNKHASVNRKFVISKEDAIKWQSEEKTYEEMAEIVGCSRMVLYRRIKELGLTNECPEAMKKLKWHEKLSEKQTKFLLGDLLGDGSITKAGMYQCNHSYKQKSFIEYKLDVLSNLISPNFNLKERVVENKQNDKKYRAYYLRTMSNSLLKDIRNKYYPENVKIFPSDYLINSDFDGYSLAAWYMGDGSLQNKRAFLWTYGYGYEGNLKILMFLNSRFGIRGILMKSDQESRNEDCRNFINIKGESAEKFFALVSPHIIPSLRYKLPKEYR